MPDTFENADLAFGPKPLEWRLHAKGGLVWRFATLDDLPELHALWDEMDHRARELDPQAPKQDRPDLFSMPVLLTLVAIDEQTGRIDSAIYGECVVDWTMIGTSRRTARAVREVHPFLALFLFPRTIRVARMLVPRRLERHMAKLFPQMANITHLYAQFVHVIRK